jgi:hypothetical protein
VELFLLDRLPVKIAIAVVKIDQPQKLNKKSLVSGVVANLSQRVKFLGSAHLGVLALG